MDNATTKTWFINSYLTRLKSVSGSARHGKVRKVKSYLIFKLYHSISALSPIFDILSRNKIALSSLSWFELFLDPKYCF